MIKYTTVPKGKLEKFLTKGIEDGCTILEIEMFTKKYWKVKYDNNEAVCRVCEGPCEDPEVGICDSCSDEPSVRIGRFL